MAVQVRTEGERVAFDFGPSLTVIVDRAPGVTLLREPEKFRQLVAAAEMFRAALLDAGVL